MSSTQSLTSHFKLYLTKHYISINQYITEGVFQNKYRNTVLFQQPFNTNTKNTFSLPKKTI
jgi:hypothetical protein